MISDFTVCVITCPIKMLGHIFGWGHFGLLNSDHIALMVTLDLLENIPLSCSTLSMMCVAIDRYCDLKKYEFFGRKFSRKRVCSVTSIIVFISSGVFSLFESLSKRLNIMRFQTSIIKLLVMHVVPMIIVCTTGAVSAVAGSSTAAEEGIIATTVGTSLVGMIQKRPSAEQSVLNNLRTRKRLGYFMLSMAVLFLFLWGPYTVCEILNLCLISGINPNIMQLTEALGMMHSALSPILSIATLDPEFANLKRWFAYFINAFRRNRPEE